MIITVSDEQVIIAISHHATREGERWCSRCSVTGNCRTNELIAHEQLYSMVIRICNEQSEGGVHKDSTGCVELRRGGSGDFSSSDKVGWIICAASWNGQNAVTRFERAVEHAVDIDKHTVAIGGRIHQKDTGVCGRHPQANCISCDKVVDEDKVVSCDENTVCIQSTVEDVSHRRRICHGSCKRSTSLITRHIDRVVRGDENSARSASESRAVGEGDGSRVP